MVLPATSFLLMPGSRSANSIQFLPLSGTCCICFASMLADTSEVVVATAETSAVTSTAVLVAAGWSWRSIVRVCPTSSVIRASAGANPSESTRTT